MVPTKATMSLMSSQVQNCLHDLPKYGALDRNNSE